MFFVVVGKCRNELQVLLDCKFAALQVCWIASLLHCKFAGIAKL